MKSQRLKHYLGVFLVTALLILVFSTTALAASKITVVVDGKTIATDVAPVEKSGRVLVPLRPICTVLGMEVQWFESRYDSIWDGSQQTWFWGKTSPGLNIFDNSTKPGFKRVVIANIGDSNALVSEREIANEDNVTYQDIVLDVAPQLINGRTMVPVRLFSEAFGYRLEWDNANRKVAITTK